MNNISAVFSKAGATATHTPGYATQRQQETENASSSASGEKSEKENATDKREFVGVGTDKHAERFGDQLPEVCVQVRMFILLRSQVHLTVKTSLNSSQRTLSPIFPFLSTHNFQFGLLISFAFVCSLALWERCGIKL